MIKFREISNFLFLMFILLLFCFAIFNFYFGFSWHSVILSILSTALISITSVLIYKNISNKTALTKLEQKQKQETLSNLLITPKQKQSLFFKKIISGTVLNFFSTEPFNDDNLYQALQELNEHDGTEGTIICNGISPQTLFKINSIENYKLAIVTYDNLFLKLKQQQMIPHEFTITFKNKSKLNFKQVFLLLFNKKHTKNYCFFGFVMLVSSAIIPFSIYYKIFTCIFFGLAIACCFYNYFGKYQKKTS